MPGSVANNFARNHARSHDDRVLGEREWEQFGQALIAYDLEQRKYWMEQHRPDLALNLPVKDIQSAHDASFEQARIAPNAWTPRQLLEAARLPGGAAAAQRVWQALLANNQLSLGLG